MVGAAASGMIWVFWRLGWKIENCGERWDKLPLLERLMAVVIVIGWTALVEVVAWYSSS